MRNLYLLSAVLLTLVRGSVPASAADAAGSAAGAGATIVDDKFANGNSQKQDLANNSLWLFNARTNTVRTDQTGSATFDITNAGGSEAFWAYFSQAGTPVALAVGDKLSVSVTFTLTGFQNNGQDIRWGVLDSLGTRNTTNLTGGMNDTTFINDTGYGLDFYASGTGSPFVIGRRSNLTSGNVFTNFGDFTPISGTGASSRQALVDGVPYTLTYTIERQSATTTQITATVTGGALSNYSYSAVESNPSPNVTFDYFAFRVTGTAFASVYKFTEIQVQYFPAPPTITSQPQSAALTLQVGSAVTMAIGASGNQISYQWQKDGQPISGNATATTPTLSLSNVQHSDAGSYTAVVSNAGGSVTSSPVILSISDTPVPPAPKITTQPANTVVTLGNAASLSVTASGDGLLYQWFKNGVLIPNARDSRLNFPNPQVSDSGSYSVVVGNSSGSIASAAATLLVVSPMSISKFVPANGTGGLCVDGSLAVQFSQPPQVGTSGRIKIYDSTGKVVDTIDMSANPQTRTIGGTGFVYYPIIVTGNTATIYPHVQLPYGGSYYVTMDPGVVTDAAGAPFAGFSDVKLWNFVTRNTGPATGSTALTVAADGTGDFCTVQAAIDFVPAGNTAPFTITVQPGTYTEINYVPSTKPFIKLRGADRNASIIQYSNNNNLNNGNARAQFGVDATDFTLEDITLHNTTPKGGSQSEAFRGNNQRIALNRVNLMSFQDTLYLQGTGFVTDSYIEGDVDFMWGNGAVYLQNSELKMLTSAGYYTQIRNPQTGNGYVFVNCKLDSAAGVTGAYLSRIDPTVFPYSQVVFINNAMGSHIAPVGWLLNNATTAPNVQFWEYQSTDLNGAPLDVSQRLKVSRQISDSEAAQWSDPGFVLGWAPYTVNTPVVTTTVGAPIVVNWTAPPKHSAKDWVGLYQVTDSDYGFLAWQYTGANTKGSMTFTAPSLGRLGAAALAGKYELRYFTNDGYTKVSTSTTVVVK